MKYLQVILFFTLATCFSVSGQAQYSGLSDTAQVISLNTQAEANIPIELDLAVNQAEQALLLATDINYLDGKMKSLNLLGEATKIQKKYPSSLDYYLQASKELERAGRLGELTDVRIEIGNLFQAWDAPDKALDYYLLAYPDVDSTRSPVLKAEILNHLGICYHATGNRAEAIRYFQLLLELHKRHSDKNSILNTLTQLSDINTETNSYQQAIDHQLQILELKMQMGDTQGEVATINNIGYLYKNLNNNPLALKYFERSLELSRQAKPNQPSKNEDIILMNIAFIYQAKGDYGNALQSLFAALLIREERGDDLGASEVNYEIAYTYQALNRLKLAREHAKAAVDLAEKEKANENLVRSYKILSDVYLSGGDDHNALKYYKKYAEMMNQLYTAQIRQRQENLKNQLQVEKKEKELKLLMIDKELKDLALKELRATSGKKETDITLLKREKQLQQVSLKIKEAESEKDKQALLLSKQALDAEKKDKEIELLQKDKSIQLLALNKKKLEEQEKQKTIQLLNERKALQEAELSRSKAMRTFFFGLSLLFAIILFLIYRGYRQKQKANRSLALRNLEIQEQRDRIQGALGELQAAQSQIVQSEKMASLGELTAGIAHEINNPINFVYAGADGLRTSLEGLLEVLDKYAEIDHTGNLAEIRKVLTEVQQIKKQLYYDETKDSVFSVVEAIKEGASRTAEIVKGLRSFSRLDETDLKWAHIHEGIDNTLILLNPKIDRGHVSVIKKYDPAIDEIECFPSQLNQVFMNILSNAVEAIEAAGEITIETKNWGEKVQVTISDTGVGMSDAVKSKIFQPFFTTKDPGEGTGLGLSITFGIIDKHQGQMKVKSQPGKGTSFIITLPKKITPELAIQ